MQYHSKQAVQATNAVVDWPCLRYIIRLASHGLRKKIIHDTIYLQEVAHMADSMRDKELLKLLLKHGWKVIRINGSHHILQKEGNTETIPVHGRDVPKGLLIKILKRCGLDRKKGAK